MQPARHRPSLPLALGALLSAAGLLAAAGAGAQLVNSATARSASGGLFNAVGVDADNDPDDDNNIAGAAVRVIDAAEVVSTVVAVADLAVSKIADPGAVTAGDQMTYHLEVENLGPSSAQDVTITDPLPPQVTFVSLTASAGGSCVTPAVGSSGTVTCSWAGDTGPGEVRSVDLVVEVAPGTPPSTVENDASASSPTTDPEADNDTATAAVLVTTLADLEVSKTADPGAVTAGDQVTYHLEVVNLGPSSAQDVALIDPLPPQVTFVSLTASPGGSCASPPVGSTGTVSCSWAGATGPGEVRSVDVVVEVVENARSSTVVNGVSASSPTTDPEPDNDTATAAVQVTALSVLEIPALSPAAALLLAALLAACGLLALRRAFPGT